jgi:hypothetical protein
MENIGYVLDKQTDTLTLKNCQLLDMEKIMKLGFDWFLTQVLIQFFEDIYAELKNNGYSWKEVAENAINFVGTEQECAIWLKENVVPESDSLRNGSERRLKHLTSSETNGRINEENLFVNAKVASRTRLPHEGLDPSYNSVEKWLKDSHADDHHDHLRRIERHKEIARQQEMARQEDDLRRQYIDMKKHHQQGEVTRPYGDQLKFDPIDSDGQNTRIGKTSPNMRIKVPEKREELPMAIPKNHKERKTANNIGNNQYSTPSYSSAISNGRVGSNRSPGSDTNKLAADTCIRNNADYLKFLEGDAFNLDDDEDLYSDVISKLSSKFESFVVVDTKDQTGESQKRAARPLSEVYTRPYALNAGLRDPFADCVSHDSASNSECNKASVPDVYSKQGTLEDHMKNSLTALGLESEASSMDCGFDDWVKDYKERDEARKENKHLDLDWARYPNLQAAAQDYLGNKTDAFSPEGKSLFDFDIPSLDIRRPPGASDYGIGEIHTPGTEKESKLDSTVESDGHMRHSTTGFPSMGMSGRSVVLEKPTDTKRKASSRYSLHLPLTDMSVPRTGKFPTYTSDSNRRPTLTSQAAGADMTRPEYAQILKESLKGVNTHSDLGHRSVSSLRVNRNSVTKSLMDESAKEDRDRNQSVDDSAIHYNTLPANPSSGSVWKCKNCDHINGNSRDICLYCKRGREFPGKKWQCVDCTLLNPPENDVCTVCDKSRTKGSEKHPLEVGGYECPKCTYINQTGAKKCKICDDPLIVYAVHL